VAGAIVVGAVVAPLAGGVEVIVPLAGAGVELVVEAAGAGIAGLAGAEVVVAGAGTVDGTVEWPAKTKYAMTINATIITPPTIHPVEELLLTP
jgi:hypothetical protein